jgi:hypothetical protein
MKKFAALVLALGAALSLLSQSSMAAVLTLSFDRQVGPPPGSVGMGGPAPWLNLTITDGATPGTVSLTVTTSLSAPLSPPQTLTGLWLNIPTVAGSLTGLTVSGGTGTGVPPFAFTALAPNNSEFTTTQSTLPAGATAAQVGRFNIYLKFPNNAGAFQGSETETFDLIASGAGAASFTAAAFNAFSLPTAVGNSYLALASITNAGGTGGSGIAYLAPAAVPLPGALGLLIAGSGGLMGFMRRRKSKG